MCIRDSSTVHITTELVQPIFTVLVTGMLFSVFVAWTGGRVLGFSAAANSSIVQAAGRHNTYISLAIAERLLGESGLLIATLATALLVPVTNIAVVTSMATILNSGEDKLVKKVFSDLLRNPLIVAIALGLSANFLGWKNIIVLHDVTGILANAALPVVLLCIGASLKFKEFRQSIRAIWFSGTIKFMVFPGLVILMSLFSNLSAELAIIFCIYAASPTATSAFALSRQMGGDYRLMASLITQQTLISFITLPLTLYLVMRIFGKA